MNLIAKVFIIAMAFLGNEKSLKKAYAMMPTIAFAFKDETGQMGMTILYAIIGVVVTIIVLANAIPVLWPAATSASGNITAMTGTDAGTTMIQTFWPIGLLIVGLAIGIGVIAYILRQFGLLGG